MKHYAVNCIGDKSYNILNRDKRMLTEIHIRNLVTIQSLHLECKSGTTVITGETGAGKSILIDAIELALGSRAGSDIIPKDQDKAEISVCFNIEKCIGATEWLKHHDLYQDSNECILRRTIYRDGRSRSFINGMPTTLQSLRELSEFLIQIHGQHEHQSLLKSDAQRNLLDQYGGYVHIVDKVNVLSHEWHQLNDKIGVLREKTEERSTREAFLKFQLQELSALQLTQDEFQRLDIEHKQLAHAGELLQNINQTLALLTDNEEQNVLHSLHLSLQLLESVQKVDPKITLWTEALKTAIIHVSDTEDDMRRYLDSIDLDPERLQWVEARITTVFAVARKHKVNPHELLELQNRLMDEYQELANSDSRLQEFEKKLKDIECEYKKIAAILSENRKKSSKKLSEEVTTLMQELSLKNAEFEIFLDHSNIPSFSHFGCEKIIFQIKTNTGSLKHPLAKIASGGELSRIGLAIHLATAGKHTKPTLIFDEVDVGVSGGTAEMVGKLLRRLGNRHQVFCITHQPQVAALQHQHIGVTKTHYGTFTLTDIRHLSSQEKIQELARMLGGIELTQKTLAHAQELVEKSHVL